MSTNDPTVVTAAVSVWRRILAATPADHADRAGALSNLGIALQVQFERMGTQADLDETINVYRAAVAAAPADHPDRAAMLSNLGSALRVRFQRVGEQPDLDGAIEVGRAAVAATPTDHPDQARSLSNLGIALRARFERMGALADLDEAISVGRAAVAAISTDHPDRAMCQSHLGLALRARFARTGKLADLDEAIEVGQAAVAATPDDHPDLAGRLSNLGIALQDRFESTGELADLDKAIRVCQAAVAATPDDHPKRAGRLSNMGGVLRDRFQRTRTQSDLDESIRMDRVAVEATPADHPDRAAMLSNLGGALWVRFEQVRAQPDLDEAITTYVQGVDVELGAPSIRIRAARTAASLSAPTDARGAADLLERAVRLLPKTAPRRLHRSDQQYALGQFAGLASDAAALALRANAPDLSAENPATRALGLLELGRGVLLSQALDTRSDLTDLQVQHPELAARFIELRDQLDQPGDALASAEDTGLLSGWVAYPVEDRHQLAAAFEATVAEIRRQGGFETFLLPPEQDQLRRHAQQGPIVMVNFSRYGSDALVLTPDEITALPLPDLTPDALIDQITSFHQALGTTHDRACSAQQWADSQDTLSAVLEWLWDAAAHPILDTLGYQRSPVPGTAWPRMWWVPGGLLSLLPLHAAGYHREPQRGDSGRRTVLDRVISSYTPTVRALGYARERSSTSTVGVRALIVAMPTTPGLDSPLGNVTKEAHLVRQRITGSTLLIEDPVAPAAQLPTKATVLAHLSECAIAHFACHGASHPSDPSQSLLLLHDHDTDPLTVTSLASVRLDQAQLAYLSACRTAVNPATDLADEAIHLTTAFQLAGYPQVVGTLWEINDALSVRVADAFYDALTTSDNTLDTTRAAQALHHTVRTIRDKQPARPSLWAAYLHAGA